MKSTGFHYEICQISWNPPDFICKWGNLHMKSAGFHAWNPPNFMVWNLPDFMHEIRQISSMKSAGFHGDIHLMLYFSSEPIQIHWICSVYKSLPWNLPDFMKSAEFHEIHRISWWNPPDFMVKSAEFHVFPKWAKDQWSYFYVLETEMSPSWMQTRRK